MRISLWEKEAIEDLRFYLPSKNALEHLKYQYGYFEDDWDQEKPGFFDIGENEEEGVSLEDSLIDHMLMRDKLQKRYDRTKAKIEFIEKGLSQLNQKQRDLLDAYYIDPQNREGHQMDWARDRPFIKDALYRFTVSMYGSGRE